MLSVYYNLLTLFSVICCGFVIKFMDDFVDRGYESAIVINPKKIRIEGIFQYGVMLLTISLALNLKLNASLLCASYIIGMFYDMNRKLGLNLKGYQESLLVFLFSTIFLGSMETLTSIVIMVIIQLIDDLLDRKVDKKYGQKNAANKYGAGEVALSLGILIIGLILIDFAKLIMVLVAYAIVMLILEGNYHVLWNLFNYHISYFSIRLRNRKENREEGGRGERGMAFPNNAKKDSHGNGKMPNLRS